MRRNGELSGKLQFLGLCLSYDGDLKFEWRLMYYIYVENNLRRHSHTHTLCVVRCTVLSVEEHRRYRIFVMQRRQACVGDHGTGGGGTLSPPLGTATHRYIFPTAFSACALIFIAIES